MNREFFHLSLLFAGLLLAAAVFYASCPDSHAFEPLPWDMSHHYFSALKLAMAAGTFDVEAIGKALFKADLYPPGRSVILGGWLLFFGESTRSWQFYHWTNLAVGILALWSCSFVLDLRDRRVFFLASTVLFLATPRVLVLSNSFMVEAPSGVLLLFSVAGLASLQTVNDRTRNRRAVLVGLLLAATVLTKYNVGLPLLPAALALALYFRARRQSAPAVAACLAAGIGLLALVTFLTLQHSGWDHFFRFAENRSNSAGLHPLVRVTRYWRIFSGSYVAYPAVAVLIASLSAVSVARRLNPLTLVAGVYVLGTVAALARHSYILQRNLYPVVLLLVLMAGVGIAALVRDLSGRDMPRRVRRMSGAAAALAGVCLAVVLLVPAVGTGRRLADRMYNGDDDGIQKLSAFMSSELSRPGPCRVVGTFNEFSAGWVRIISERAGDGADPLRVEFSYPLERDRTGLDSRPDPAYGAVVRKWRETSRERAITIDIDESSRWWTANAVNWSAWKRNFSGAIAECDDLELTRCLELPECGLRARVFLPVQRHDFDDDVGWSSAEQWGRWATATRSSVKLGGVEPGQGLRIRYAAFGQMIEPQTCLLRLNGAPIDSFTVTGKPWRWQERVLPIPATGVGETAEISFEFARLYEIGGRLCALPIAETTLVYLE